jgi:hypothetical protein
MSVGVPEIFIVLVFGLVFMAVPAASLILMILVYQKVNQIERRLSKQSDKE